MVSKIHLRPRQQEGGTHHSHEATPFPSLCAQVRGKFRLSARDAHQPPPIGSLTFRDPPPDLKASAGSRWETCSASLRCSLASFWKLRPLPAFSAVPGPPLFEFENQNFVVLLAGWAGRQRWQVRRWPG